MKTPISTFLSLWGITEKEEKKILRVKQCNRCFRGNSQGSQICQHCGNDFAYAGKRPLVNKIRRLLKIDRPLAVTAKKAVQKVEPFFTFQEIEKLLRLDNMNVLMFLTLDSIDLLDEKALIELGEMMTKMNRA